MTAQREHEVYLPIGYTDSDGYVHRQAVIRKMRGYDEELLYDESLNGGRLVTELLGSCVLRLGNTEKPGSTVMSDLYTADRNYLLLELRRITLGNRLNSAYYCPHCGSHVSVAEDLGELDIKRLEENQDLPEIRLTLEDGFQDRKGQLHCDMSFGLPRGKDEEFVAPMVSRDPMKAQDALILRCIKTFGSLSRSALEAYGVKILRELTLGDRQKIQNVLNDNMPGVDFQRPVHCEPCGNTFKGMMDISDFFVVG